LRSTPVIDRTVELLCRELEQAVLVSNAVLCAPTRSRPVPLSNYTRTFVEEQGLTNFHILFMIILIRRFAASKDRPAVFPSNLGVKLLVASTVLTCKTLADTSFFNSNWHWTTSAVFPTTYALNKFERLFLMVIDYRLYVSLYEITMTVRSDAHFYSTEFVHTLFEIINSPQ
jgi:hypothetical protein